jgi:hypothetical protein
MRLSVFIAVIVFVMAPANEQQAAELRATVEIIGTLTTLCAWKSMPAADRDRMASLARSVDQSMRDEFALRVLDATAAFGRADAAGQIEICKAAERLANELIRSKR